mgnify:CR=1 FL=1
MIIFYLLAALGIIGLVMLMYNRKRNQSWQLLFEDEGYSTETSKKIGHLKERGVRYRLRNEKDGGIPLKRSQTPNADEKVIVEVHEQDALFAQKLMEEVENPYTMKI